MWSYIFVFVLFLFYKSQHESFCLLLLLYICILNASEVSVSRVSSFFFCSIESRTYCLSIYRCLSTFWFELYELCCFVFVRYVWHYIRIHNSFFFFIWIFAVFLGSQIEMSYWMYKTFKRRLYVLCRRLHNSKWFSNFCM